MKKTWLRHEMLLLVVLAIEVLIFNAIGRRFLTADNVANIVRQSVEIGLLAIDTVGRGGFALRRAVVADRVAGQQGQEHLANRSRAFAPR